MSLTEHFHFTDLGEGPQSPEVLPLDWGFSLADGRDIHITRLEQRPTYAGILCGLPRAPEAKVTSALDAARKWDNDFHGEPVVIPANILRGIKSAPTDPRYSHHGRMRWEMLPQVTTFAEFTSPKTVRDHGEAFSSALLVWWQPQFGIPVDEELLGRIRTVDWVRHARDWTP